MYAVETTNLTKYYGKSRGIIDLTLSVEQGEFFGFIGPNGSGKSTTIRSLLGLISPTSGQGRVFGYDIVKNKKAILSQVGYMASEALFYGNMKVSDIIKLSADLRGQNCKNEAARLCSLLELDVNKRIVQLSLGNRKKVSMVCAMQHKPSLYILDEPTSGLDPLMHKIFFDLLSEQHKEGATIFLSSHILSEIQQHCSRAAIIKEGHLIALDKVENLSKTNTRRVVLRGIDTVPDELSVSDVQILDQGISFLYQGDTNKLIKVLSGLSLSDVTIAEPDLEEVFMHYYEGGEGNDRI